jgi:aminoglycoside/choline kinase family phosphotransferase
MQKDIAGRLLAQTLNLKDSRITGIQHLAGDASGREYHRIELAQAPYPSVILMKLNHAAGPLASGEATNQDQTFVEIAAFLQKHGLPVPGILADAGNEGYLLVEDVGDKALWQDVFDEPGSAPNEGLYQQCCQQLKKLQSIKRDDSCIAFRRQMSCQVYYEEIERFITFYAVPKGFPESTLPVFRQAFQKLSESISRHPQVLVYRDFNAWNIHVDAASRVRFIDFQDLLLGSDAYDLVSLLHDRDIDLKTGLPFIEKIIGCYEGLLTPPEGFRQRYCEVLLQRYFRLSGQFDMLAEKSGREHYRAWIPGCFKRISSVIGRFDYMQEVAEVLYRNVPEFRAGFDAPWGTL